MIKTFTENDVVRFVYDEVTEPERTELKEALESDNHLSEENFEMNEIVKMLDAFVVKAPDSVVTSILYASKNMKLV